MTGTNSPPSGFDSGPIPGPRSGLARRARNARAGVACAGVEAKALGRGGWSAALAQMKTREEPLFLRTEGSLERIESAGDDVGLRDPEERRERLQLRVGFRGYPGRNLMAHGHAGLSIGSCRRSAAAWGNAHSSAAVYSTG